MKVSEIKNEALRELIEDGEYGALTEVNPTDSGRSRTWALTKVKLDQDLDAIMGRELYIPARGTLTPSELRVSMLDALTGSFAETENLLYVDERDGSVYLGSDSSVAFSFIRDLGLKEDRSFVNWREAAKIETAVMLEAKFEATLFDHVIAAGQMRPEEVPEGSTFLRAEAEKEFVCGEKVDLRQRCAAAAHELAEGKCEEISVFGLLRNREGFVNDTARNTLDGISFSTPSERTTVMDHEVKTICAKEALAASIRSSADRGLIARRDMYAALTARFGDKPPSTVKVTLSGQKSDEPFSVGYRDLMNAIVHGRSMSTCEFVAPDRDRLCDEPGVDRWKRSVALDFETIHYRGKPIYEKGHQNRGSDAPSLEDVAMQAQEAAGRQPRNPIAKECDGR